MSDQPPTDAQRFANMARRIEHNKDSTFGGAFVICIPGGIVPPLEALLLDETGDAAQFLMVLQTKIQTVLEDIKAKQGMYGR